ncbi:MAG: flagellar biosynthesis anti-sigma factor FlgM [Phycisphaerae bacterium]|nr:flagellar biosynthesis anti-sigma factor FlgM [Phycisphaerae bacterium]MDW8262728.1 flagellar biosynthesis anti-sigma factor FlgM [Phycisphaerales bacterium]
MDPINTVGIAHPAAKLSPVRGAQDASATASPTPPRRTDRLDLSGMQGFLQVLRQNDIRGEKVAEIRAQIEAGTYETEEKLEIAIDRLIDDL